MSYLVDLFEMVYSLLYALWYPVDLVIQMVLSILTMVFDPFIELISVVYQLFYVMYQFMSDIFSYFPYTWGFIVSAIFLVKIARWIYSYVKDIEIWGFKI